MTKQKKHIIISLAIVLAVGFGIYLISKKFKASTSTLPVVSYYGKVTWDDNTPAKGVIVSVANREYVVKDDGTYSMYLQSEDFDLGVVNSVDGAPVTFYNPNTFEPYYEYAVLDKTWLEKPTTAGTIYTNQDFALGKPAANNFTLTKAPVIANKAVSFNFGFVNPTTISVVIADSTNQTVRTLTQSFNPGGSGTVTWDEKNSTGTLVRDGTYKATITGSDGANPSATLSVVSLVIANVVPNNFSQVGSPVVSKTAKTATFNYSFANPTDISIVIKSGNTIVKTVTKNFAAGGTGAVVWDEKNTAGALVPNGTYTAIATGDDHQNQPKILAAASVPILGANNFILKSTSTNRRQATFTLSFSNPTDVTVVVKGSNGRTAQTVTKSFASAGTAQTVTIGVSPPLPAGTYSATITGDDHNIPVTTVSSSNFILK